MKWAPWLFLVLVAMLTAGCGGKSDADKARTWVASNGGLLSQGAAGGWSASRANWKGDWPWSQSSAIVGCAPDLYGGTTFVQLSGDMYWLAETHGYPPDGSTYKGSAASITDNDTAQIEWSRYSLDLCGLRAN